MIHLVVNSLGMGGAERHTVLLANAASHAGLDVRLVALSGVDSLRPLLSAAVARNALLLERRRALDPAALLRYRRVFGDDRPALILTVNDYPLFFTAAALPLLSSRSAWIHVTHTTQLPHEDTLPRQLLRRALRRHPDDWVYVCEGQRRHWRSLGYDGRDHCIHNGVDVQAFAPASEQERAAARQRAGLPATGLVVGLCAGLRREKRHDLLLDALARLDAGGMDVHLLLIGDGPLRDAIELRSRSLGVAGRVRMAGQQHRVRDWLAACDVACLPSDHETFSIAVLEAMSMALPVVATRVGAVEEQFRHDREGLLVEAGDVGALADALARLADPGLRRQFGQAARARVVEQFDLGTMSRRFVSLIHQRIAERGVGAATLARQRR